jgi:Zn finger protein HypA/HybF involved in hydrogenase expression
MTKCKDDYPFGVNKYFNGSDEEWNTLKQTVVWYDQNISSYPHISVICPHCGSHNHHTVSGTDGHRACDIGHKNIFYDCPGYVLSPIH